MKLIDENIYNTHSKAIAIAQLSEVHFILGHQEEAEVRLIDAIKVKEEVDEPVERVTAAREIMRVAGIFDRHTQAQKLLEESFDLVDTVDDPQEKESILKDLIYSMVFSQDVKISRGIITQALIFAKAEPDYLSTFLVALADSARYYKDSKVAKEFFDQGLIDFNEISDPEDYAKSLASIGEAYARLGSHSQAKITLDEAINLAQKVDKQSDRSEILGAVAFSARKLNKAAYRKEVWLKLINLSNDLRNEDDRYTILSNIVSAIKRTENITNSEEILAEITNIARNFKEDSLKAYLLIQIAWVRGHLEQPKQMQQLLLESEALARKTKDKWIKSNIYGFIMWATSDLEFYNQTKLILPIALETARDARNSTYLYWAAIHFAQIGNWRMAQSVAQECESSDKLKALSKILTIWAEKQKPKLREWRETEEKLWD